MEAPADGGYGAVILLLKEDGVLQHRGQTGARVCSCGMQRERRPAEEEEKKKRESKSEREKEREKENAIAVIACAAHSISSQSRPYMVIHMCSTPRPTFIISAPAHIGPQLPIKHIRKQPCQTSPSPPKLV